MFCCHFITATSNEINAYTKLTRYTVRGFEYMDFILKKYEMNSHTKLTLYTTRGFEYINFISKKYERNTCIKLILYATRGYCIFSSLYSCS